MAMLAMIPFKKTLLIIIGAAAVTTGAFWIFGGDREPIPELTGLPELVYSRVADEVASQVVIPDQKIIFVPAFKGVTGDPDNALRARINDRLKDLGARPLIPMEEMSEGSGWLEEQGAEAESLIDWAWLASVLTKQNKKEDRPSVVLLGKMELTDDEERLRVNLDWIQVDQKAKGILKGETSTHEVAKSWFSGDYQKIRISESSRFFRLGLWTLLLIVPALVGTPLMRRVINDESNLANGMMVLAFALPGALAGWVLTAYGSGWWGGTVTLIAVLVSAAFSFVYCTIIDARR